MKHRATRRGHPQPLPGAPYPAPRGSSRPAGAGDGTGSGDAPAAAATAPLAQQPRGAHGRGRRLRRRQPVWLAGFAVVALFGAVLGWAVTPDMAGDESASVDASSLHVDPFQQATQRPTAAPTDSAAPAPEASGATTPTPTPSQAPAPPPATTEARPAPPPPPAAAAGGGRVPGGMSGLAAGSLTELRAWEAFRGSPVDVVMTFSDRSSWDTMTSPWLGAGAEKFAGFPGTWVISQPFYPTGGGDLASCANGAYNSHWAEFGRWLVGEGRADSIVRLAWEFNGNWFPWSVGNNPTAWVPCFRQVVGAMRSTNPQVRIDWAINGGSAAPFDHYPGDAYVDIIGISMYDHWPASVDEASWNETCTDNGLCSVIAFARQHGKQFSIPEWGLVGKSDTGAGRAGQAGGDNPYYIQKVYDTLRANADVLAYETYFNDSAPGNVHSSLINPTEHPNGAARYAELW